MTARATWEITIHTLRTEGIYLSAPVAKRFKEAFDKLSGTQTERYLVFHRGHRGGYEKSMDVVDTTGDGEIRRPAGPRAHNNLTRLAHSAAGHGVNLFRSSYQVRRKTGQSQYARPQGR
jgi:hypothetical protein